MGARDARLAGNEALFREVNERVAEVATHYIEVETHAEMVNFTCECGRADCAEPISMTLVEYEAIRAFTGDDKYCHNGARAPLLLDRQESSGPL